MATRASETALRSVRQLVVDGRPISDDRPRYCQLLRVAGVGHRARHPCVVGGRAGARRPADPCRLRLAGGAADSRRQGRLGGPGPDLAPGGWAFQYRNDFYPDVDDTAVVGMLLHRVDSACYHENIARAARWIVGMQSANGGWGAFDKDNTADFLNSIPFADHGALLDPPTVDVIA